MRSRDVIHIFLSTDNNYTVPTYIALYSLIENYRGSSKISAHILTTNDFTVKNARLLKTLTEKRSFFNLEIINMEDSFNSAVVNNSRLSIATMYRLMIPRIVNQIEEQQIEKCIYLDSDIVIEGDIAELYNVDLEGCHIGGVKDRAIVYESNRDHTKALGIPTINKYINAGVIVFYLKEFEADNIWDKLENAGLESNFEYNDQDVINMVCYEEIKLLPDKYNVMNSACYHTQCLSADEMMKIRKAQKTPIILHYNTARKPWIYKKMINARNWWKYIDMQDEQIINDYIVPFLDDQKVSFIRREEETIKALLVKLGVYNTVTKLYHVIRR